MIPREEVEFTLALAQKGVRCEAPAKVMAELCRVYLAWVDAPEATSWVNSVGPKRVKLVEVPDA